MHPFFILASAEVQSAGTIDQIAANFGVNWPHFLAQVISFSIVAFLLHRLAYRPILQVLAERKQRIAEGLANAEKIKAELARTEADRQEVLHQAHLQANRLIAEAQAAAARVHEAEIQKAVANAEQILAKAREAATLDYTRVMGELKREFGRLVVETTARVTGKILSLEDQRRLADEANRELAA